MICPAHPSKVDAVQQHRQGGRINLDVRNVVESVWDPKSSPLKPLKINGHPPTLPEQNLTAVSSHSEENKEVTDKNVHLPLIVHDSRQAIETLSQVDSPRAQPDPNTTGQRQHERLNWLNNDTT